MNLSGEAFLVELKLLRELEALIVRGLQTESTDLEARVNNRMDLASLLQELKEVRAGQSKLGMLVMRPGSSALTLGPNCEIDYFLSEDPKSMSPAWIAFAVAALKNEAVIEDLKAELLGTSEA